MSSYRPTAKGWIAAQRPVFGFPWARTEACACGGSITADVASPEAIANAVAAHNKGRAHQEWRYWGGLDLEPTDPELVGHIPLRGVTR